MRSAPARWVSSTPLGVAIVLDDFGAGYSSLMWLKQHAFRGIKLDRGFVRSLPEDAVNRTILKAVIGVGRTLGCTVTAKGVETEEQLQTLTALGCERIQGFLLARPLTAGDLARLLRSGDQSVAKQP